MVQSRERVLDAAELSWGFRLVYLANTLWSVDGLLKDSISLGLLQLFLDIALSNAMVLHAGKLMAPFQVCHAWDVGGRWLDIHNSVACSNGGEGCICIRGRQSGSLLEGISMQIADYERTRKPFPTKAAW